MPIKLRRAKGRRRRADQVPEAALWWLRHGCTAEGGGRAAWLVSNLHFDRQVSGWTRADLRELGYGPQIDALVRAGRCPPDGWRKPPRAEVIDLARHAANPPTSR